MVFQITSSLHRQVTDTTMQGYIYHCEAKPVTSGKLVYFVTLSRYQSKSYDDNAALALTTVYNKGNKYMNWWCLERHH